MYNIRLFAGPKQKGDIFNIYISSSGMDEYLFTQRYTEKVYGILESGVDLEDLKRLYRTNKRGRYNDIVKNTLRHIITVADDFVKYELEPCGNLV